MKSTIIPVNQKRLYVADDSEAMCHVLQHFLELRGYLVDTTVNAKTLGKLTNNLPDLILLDVCFYGIDGTDVCKTLKKRTATKKIPIIIMSGMRNIKEITKNCGADGYIAKPFNPDDLVLKIKSHLATI